MFRGKRAAPKCPGSGPDRPEGEGAEIPGEDPNTAHAAEEPAAADGKRGANSPGLANGKVPKAAFEMSDSAVVDATC